MNLLLNYLVIELIQASEDTPDFVHFGGVVRSGHKMFQHPFFCQSLLHFLCARQVIVDAGRLDGQRPFDHKPGIPFSLRMVLVGAVPVDTILLSISVPLGHKMRRDVNTGAIRTTLTFLILGKTDILAFSDSFAIELSFVFWVYGLKQPLKASKWPLNFSLKP